MWSFLQMASDGFCFISPLCFRKKSMPNLINFLLPEYELKQYLRINPIIPSSSGSFGHYYCSSQLNISLSLVIKGKMLKTIKFQKWMHHVLLDFTLCLILLAFSLTWKQSTYKAYCNHCRGTGCGLSQLDERDLEVPYITFLKYLFSSFSSH